MYEKPTGGRSPHGYVTRDEVEDMQARADVADLVIDLISNDPRVRGAILQLVRATTPPPSPARRTGRGR